jgi:hypothetical protein
MVLGELKYENNTRWRNSSDKLKVSHGLRFLTVVILLLVKGWSNKCLCPRVVAFSTLDTGTPEYYHFYNNKCFCHVTVC